jgi:prepilin-type N-terminal cleavage/methylation domain-containing protein
MDRPLLPTLASRPPRLQGGLTLLEVLIALIIVSVALGIFLTSSNTSLIGNERSRVYGGAATATVEAHEAVKLMSMDQIKALSNTPVPHSQGSRITVTATARNVLSTDVGDYATLDASKLQFVTLSTAFMNKAGVKVTKTFTTIVYKP